MSGSLGTTFNFLLCLVIIIMIQTAMGQSEGVHRYGAPGDSSPAVDPQYNDALHEKDSHFRTKVLTLMGRIALSSLAVILLVHLYGPVLTVRTWIPWVVVFGSSFESAIEL